MDARSISPLGKSISTIYFFSKTEGTGRLPTSFVQRYDIIEKFIGYCARWNRPTFRSRFLATNAIDQSETYTRLTIHIYMIYTISIYTVTVDRTSEIDSGNRPQAIDFGLRPVPGGFCREDYNANHSWIWPSYGYPRTGSLKPSIHERKKRDSSRFSPRANL